jgi:ATP-binding cassette subfamily B protein
VASEPARATARRSGRWAAALERFPALANLGRPARVPFVQQLTGTECGLACLAMILGRHGRQANLEELRDVCAAGRDGANARDLIGGAAHFGLRGRGVRADIEDLPRLPAGSTILHWEFQHFVVLTRVDRRGIEILDPAGGRRRVSPAELRRAFTGVALVFEPTDLFRKQKRPGALYPALKEIVAESGVLGKVVQVSLALQLFGLAMPVLTGQVIDRVLPRGDLHLLAALLGGLAMLVLFRGFGELVRGHLLTHVKTLLDARMTMGFLDHLVSLPFAFFQLRDAGDLLMRLRSNTVVREQLTSTALSGVLDGSLVLVYLGVLLLGNPAMAGAALVATLLDLAVFLLAHRRQRALATQLLDVQAKAQSYEVEMLTAMETLKAMGGEQRAVSHWSNLFVDQLNVQLRRDRLSSKTDAAVGAIRLAGPLLVLAVGTAQVLSGQLSLGAMLALSAVAGGFLEPLSGLVQTLIRLETVRAYLQRVADVLDAEPEQGPAPRRLAPRLSGRITLEGVSFSYPGRGAPVLSNIDLEIPAGKMVAIVGRSGSGKSTLAHLILGLHRPSAGRVLFDGHDLVGLDLRSLREQVGVVNQSFALFGGTVRENISLSDPAMPLPEVEAAARLACIHDDIAAMPMGYQSLLIDRGGSLSGGQRQRLALARALARRPAVLLLDEATSALDAATERQVQGALDRLSCTRVVIAHRLSTIRRADLIVVMQDGRIAEAGSHTALLARAGAYARLVDAQLDGADQPSRQIVQSQTIRLSNVAAARGPRPADPGTALAYSRDQRATSPTHPESRREP